MRKIDGGPAFPQPMNAEGVLTHVEGMSLRDWFAGQAVRGLVGCKDAQDAARQAYEVADAMMKERDN